MNRVARPRNRPETKGRIRRVLRMVALGLGGLIVLAQFVPAGRTNPPVTSEIAVSGEVMEVLERSCYDCHSNETVWPWYSRIAPVSWLLVREVREGREDLNYSEWGRYDSERVAELMEETREEVEEGEMPIRAYVWFHPEARLSDLDTRILAAWATDTSEDH